MCILDYKGFEIRATTQETRDPDGYYFASGSIRYPEGRTEIFSRVHIDPFPEVDAAHDFFIKWAKQTIDRQLKI